MVTAYCPLASHAYDPITVVCHFSERNYVFDRLEAFNGNQLDSYRRSAKNLMWPTNWF